MWWFWNSIRRMKPVWDWLGIIGQLALSLGIAGLLGSVGGVIWAAIIGVPLPIAIMAGYCTLVSAAYVAMAPFLFRAVSQLGTAGMIRIHDQAKPHQAWRHVSKLTLRQAAFLWCDVEPGPSMSDNVLAWFNAFRSAIQKGDLGFELSPGSGSVSERRSYQKNNPNLDTIVTRDQLKAFARQIGDFPMFLDDEA
jgi:hypothetical protein